MENLYDILGVKKDASTAEIRKAYKKRAGEYHPDKNPDDPEATVKFQALVKAYDILKDSEKRAQYDETGKVDNEPTIEDLAIDIITKSFLDISEKSDFEPRNYLQDVTKAIQNALRQCMMDKRRFDKSFDKLEYLIANTEANELFLIMLNRKQDEIKHKKAHADQGTQVMNKALELLDTFKYTGEVPQATPGQRPWVSMSSDPYIS
jgi:curved DNA-binding protein CbpA